MSESGGYAYHVLNRAVARERIFRTVRDYQAFERVLGEAKQRVPVRLLAWCVLDEGPVRLPEDWRQQVQSAETEAELAALRRSVVRGVPFGEACWQDPTAKRLHLESTLRTRGRPRKVQPASTNAI